MKNKEHYTRLKSMTSRKNIHRNRPTQERVSRTGGSLKQEKTSIFELEHQLQQLKVTMEKNNQEMSTMKVVRDGEVEINEELRETQSQVFHALGDIQRHYDDLVVLQDQLMNREVNTMRPNVPLIKWKTGKKDTP
jgi:hypothetical protein